jgi:hypothetical protein
MSLAWMHRSTLLRMFPNNYVSTISGNCPENGGSVILRRAGNCQLDYIASYLHNPNDRSVHPREKIQKYPSSQHIVHTVSISCNSSKSSKKIFLSTRSSGSLFSFPFQSYELFLDKLHLQISESCQGLELCTAMSISIQMV